jgi:hypothetical protein
MLMLISAGFAAAQRPMPIVQNAVPSGPMTRPALVDFQALLDAKVESVPKENPFNILVPTQGVYLAGYGVVFTTQIFLINHAASTPFNKGFSPADIARLHKVNTDRLPVLKQTMREMLMIAAQKLAALPAKESITIAVALHYYSHENRTGLPWQLVLQAPRQAILDYQANRMSLAQFDQALKLQEF